MNNIALITRKVKEKGMSNSNLNEGATIEQSNNLVDTTVNYSKLNQSFSKGRHQKANQERSST
jgi:hypothetical protein